MARMPITELAKKAAKRGLKNREKFSDPPGLTKSEAKKAGIASGVERAKQLIRSKTLSLEDAKHVARFYQRFKNKRTPRAECAIDLWGGRDFGRKAVAWIKNNS